jgi:hypothetical protein
MVCAARAHGGYTAVAQPKRHGAVSHERILERVHGGDFVDDPTGLSFSNDSGVTVTRLQDDPSGDVDWSGKTVSARTVATFTGKHRTAGYFAVTTAGQTKPIIDASRRGFAATGSGSSGGAVEGQVAFGTARGRKGKVFSSAVASNPDGIDHVVTYEVNGTGQLASVYLLCWEDKFASRSDRDYNDFVIEVQAAEIAARAPLNQPLLIPLPPAGWTGLAGLLGIASIKPFRRRWAR